MTSTGSRQVQQNLATYATRLDQTKPLDPITKVSIHYKSPSKFIANSDEKCAEKQCRAGHMYGAIAPPFTAWRGRLIYNLHPTAFSKGCHILSSSWLGEVLSCSGHIKPYCCRVWELRGAQFMSWLGGIGQCMGHRRAAIADERGQQTLEPQPFVQVLNHPTQPSSPRNNTSITRQWGGSILQVASSGVCWANNVNRRWIRDNHWSVGHGGRQIEKHHIWKEIFTSDKV